jgi:hypothetical protein
VAKFSASNSTASAYLVDCVGRKFVMKKKVFLFDASESVDKNDWQVSAKKLFCVFLSEVSTTCSNLYFSKNKTASLMGKQATIWLIDQ